MTNDTIELGHQSWLFPREASPVKHGPTLDKPQTKVFFAFDSFWALLVREEGTDRPEHAIFEFNSERNTWRDTGTTVTDAALATVDAHFDGESLWVATRSPEIGVSLQRFLPEVATRSWQLDPRGEWRTEGVTTPSVSVTTSADHSVWLTFCANKTPYYAGGPIEDFPKFASATPIPAATSTLIDVDLSAVVAIGNEVGFMWSDQGTETFFFAIRSPGGDWRTEIASSGGLVADDHIAARHFDGRLYVAVKTSRDDNPARASDNSLLMLLVRERDGRWHEHQVVTIDYPVTRPMPIIEPTADRIHVLYTYGPNPGIRTIREKVASLGDLYFEDGPGEIVLSANDAQLNDVTSSRSPLSEQFGALVIASDGTNRRYYYRVMRPTLEGKLA